MTRVIYPGSFDPPTKGHIHIARRAAALFGDVVVLVCGNPHKKTVLTLDERAALLRKCLEGVEGVRVATGGPLLARDVERLGGQAILRGLRSDQDYGAERPVADGFLDVFGIETLFMQCDASLGYVSSSMARELLRQGGPADKLLPQAILKEIEAAYR